ncbi:MAG: radical SAM family heme chaperone HemW [Bacilli bacterium]|nr:radical SAM family heme chaperone HemW [Bacilli bacterium]
MVKSLYIHIPFCQKICDYCDFTKLQYFHNFAVSYLNSLEKDLKDNVPILEFETIYVGGGTPTVLEDELLEKLLILLKPYAKNVKEYTFETNPETLTKHKVELLSRYGVNRVSIGVESTNDEILKAINRGHTFADVVNSVSLLRENNINNINLDLILGLPNVSEKMLKKDLENILSLNPDHISTYSLTVHEHTVFYLNRIEEPDNDYSRHLYDLVHETLINHDYEHYEVSNFAKPGKKSEHNLTYWRNEEYYAAGLGASGYVDDIRYKNTTNFSKYIENNFEKEIEKVTLKDKFEYQIMLNLRTFEGLDLSRVRNIYNKDIYKEKQSTIDKYINNGYLIKQGNILKATYEGMMILDQIIVDLI